MLCRSASETGSNRASNRSASGGGSAASTRLRPASARGSAGGMARGHDGGGPWGVGLREVLQHRASLGEALRLAPGLSLDAYRGNAAALLAGPGSQLLG